jgi:ATP-binding cassette subfamily B protein
MFANAKDLSQQYYQEHKVGDLMSLFTNDLDTIQECFSWGLLTAVDALVLGVMAVVKMFRMNAVMSLLSMVPILLMALIGVRLARAMRSRWKERQEAFSALSDFAQESFSGISVIKAFVKELKEQLAFDRINEQNEVTNLRFTKYATGLRVLIGLFIESVMCVILGYGGTLVYKKIFNAGELMEFIGYFTTAIWPAMALSDLIDRSSRGGASLRRVSDLLDARQDVRDGKNVGTLENVRGDIEFRDLTFRYPGAEFDALSDVSFSIRAGENVGLVGKTGCGKTCLVDLILRTYNVPDGTLFIDGHDVNRIRIRDVRKACAYVPQDNFLFSETIRNNISFSDRNASLEAVQEAAVLADVDGNIREFPLGYDTVLGERGVTVSGGQKQRISIARALMKNAPILILDDSVSAVDTDTEKVILENLKRTRRGKTTILIAHRISTIEGLDKIVFVEDGRILAVGSHAELMETCPAYGRMVELQRLEDEAKE